MDSYYQFAPLFRVNKPIVVTGRDARDAKRAAQFVTAQTGLTLSDVDDWFQHHAECTPSEWAKKQGRAARRNLEGRLLDRALNRQPCGVIYLDPGAFSAPDLRRVLALKTHVMFIEREDSSAKSDTSRQGFLYRFLSRKTPIDKAKSGADTVIEAGQLEALAIAQLIVRKLKSQDGPHLAEAAS